MTIAIHSPPPITGHRLPQLQARMVLLNVLNTVRLNSEVQEAAGVIAVAEDILVKKYRTSTTQCFYLSCSRSMPLPDFT